MITTFYASNSRNRFSHFHQFRVSVIALSTSQEADRFLGHDPRLNTPTRGCLAQVIPVSLTNVLGVLTTFADS